MLGESVFGFLQPQRSDVVYRQLYAGCCAFQHRRFGIETLPLLSYEAVFLYALAVDAGCCDLPDEGVATCCRLRTRGGRLHAVDPRIAEFCVSFGVLLAAIKLEDDVRDDRSLVARFALWRLKSRIRKAKDYFASLDTEFHQRVTSAVQQHLALERESRHPSLAVYSEPTAAAFAYVFELFTQMLSPTKVDATAFHAIGHAVGRAIITFDCAVDYHRDRRLGRYNPLGDTAECQSALVECQRSLSDAMWRSTDLGEQSSLAARVTAGTFERVSRYQNLVAKDNATRQARRMHPRQGDCDIPCDGACCDGIGACDCGGCDAGDAAPTGFCLLDCCGGCGPDCSTSRRRNSAPSWNRVRDRSRLDLAGEVGVTVGPLKPAGIVSINGQDIPARCDMGWIDADTEVYVVRKESFGVIVREKKPESD